MNKFKKVSGDGHQMSVAERGGTRASQGPLVFCARGVGARGSPSLTSGNVTYTVRSNASWVMVTWGPPVDRQTDTSVKTLPSCN